MIQPSSLHLAGGAVKGGDQWGDQAEDEELLHRRAAAAVRYYLHPGDGPGHRGAHDQVPARWHRRESNCLTIQTRLVLQNKVVVNNDQRIWDFSDNITLSFIICTLVLLLVLLCTIVII